MSTFKGIWYDGLAEKLVLVSFCFFKKIKIKGEFPLSLPFTLGSII